jgi:hypothetical protein
MGTQRPEKNELVCRTPQNATRQGKQVMHSPHWLDETAQEFWRKHYKALKLAKEHTEGFAVLCQTYSDYRNADDLRAKKTYLDYYLKLCKEYRLTPKSAPKAVETTPKVGDLERFIGFRNDVQIEAN